MSPEPGAGALPSWRNRKVLVTGGAGFVGSHLTERLVQLGATTRALVRYNSANSMGWLDSSSVRADVDGVWGDVRDADTVRRAMRGVDTVFHLASLIAIPYSYDAPLSYVRTNVEGTLNVCQAALEHSVERMVHTSTSETYGSARYVPIDEQHPLVGQSPYAASKIGADKIAEAFHRSFGLPVATIRPFNIYGPRQSVRAVIPTIITQALTAEVIVLGSLHPRRDFTYVADTVDAFIRMADTPAAVGQVVNVGSGHDWSIAEIAQTVLELIGRDVPIQSDSRRVRPAGSEVDRLRAHCGRAEELLGWRAERNLRDGLGETIRWIERDLHRYRTGAYVV